MKTKQCYKINNQFVTKQEFKDHILKTKSVKPKKKNENDKLNTWLNGL